MGLFSHLREVASGRNFIQNQLVDNFNKTLSRIEHSKSQKFIEDWSVLCTMNIDRLLGELFFRSGKLDEYIGFVKHLSQLNEARIVAIYKLLLGHFVATFLSNQSNQEFLQIINLSERNFKKGIFRIFEFTQDDYVTYTRLHEEQIKEPHPGYAANLHNEFLNKGFGVTAQKSIIAATAFMPFLVNAYKSFIDCLTEMTSRRMTTGEY